MLNRLTSRCSSKVLLANGLVGFVDEGRTFSSSHTTMISGACPPPFKIIIILNTAGIYKLTGAFCMVGVDGAATKSSNSALKF